MFLKKLTMKKILLITSILLTFINFSQINSTFNVNDIKIRYHSIPEKKKLKTISLHFEHSFEDTISIFINNILIQEKYLVTDESTGVALFITQKIKKNSILILKKNGIIIFELLVDTRFKIMRIFKHKDSWTVIYSNEDIEYY